MVTTTLLLPRNAQSASAQETDLSQMPYDQGILEPLGLFLKPIGGDTTTDLGTSIQRVLIFEELPTFREQFPTELSRQSAMSNLFLTELSSLGTLGVTQTNLISPP
jgi:hypothetical protein